MKACTKCGVLKSVSEFSAKACARDGRRSACKSCDRLYIEKNGARIKEQQRKYREENKDAIARQRSEHYATNKDSILEIRASYRLANREKHNACSAAWRARNPGKLNAYNSKRKSSKLQATPAWSDGEAISAIYRQASDMSKELGTPVHVDHIVPLMSKLVCGLHVPANLQMLFGDENMRKGNRRWPDMP